MTIDELRQEITRLTRTERLFKLNEIAERANVSASYITNFLNQKDRGFSPEVKSSVEKAVHELSVTYGDVAAIRNLYIEFLIGIVQRFDFRFALQHVPERELGFAKIDEIFVEPCYRSIDRERKECVEISSLFEQNSVLHLLGPAGCGKTTVIRHEILKLTKSDSNGDGELLPIFFPLNAVNRAPYDPQEHENLLDLICKWAETAGSIDVRSIVEEALKDGRAIVMLDGLDEVQPSRFHSVRQMINRFINLYVKPGQDSGNKLLVTERGTEPYGFDIVFDNSRMFQILGFDNPRIGELVDRWVGLSKDSYHADRIRRFKEAIVEDPLKHLTKRALFLTLMTVIFLRRNPEELFVSPSIAFVMHLFFKTVLGLWNNVRSLDGFPTPVADEIPQEVAQRLLSHLAWDMVDSNGEIRNSIPLYKAKQSIATCYQRYDFSPHAMLRDDPTTLERVDIFLDRCKDAGIIIIEQVNDQYEIQFLHTLEHSWFLTFNLRQNHDTRLKYLNSFMNEVSPISVKWKEPLALGLGAMGPVDGNIDGLTEAVDRALGSWPLDNERLQKVLPLGIDLCLNLVEEGGLYKGAAAKVLHNVRHFYETTEYAVVTKYLQPVIIELLRRGAWGNDIPREPSSIEQWLNQIQTLKDPEWVTEIDRIWRYQTDISCFSLLLKAVTDRLGTDQIFQKLCRRLVFGSLFAAESPPHRATISLLGSVIENVRYDPVIRAMAAYVLKEIDERLSKTGIDPEVSTLIEQTLDKEKDGHCVSRAKAKSVHLLVDELAKCAIRDLAKGRSEILVKFKLRTESDEDEVIRNLVDLTRKNNEHRRRAIAVILLAAIFEDGTFEKSFSDLYPDRKYGFVLDALLDAADTTGEHQYDNVDACQVYDFAAWAMRAIFLQSDDLSGLPLPPRGWRPR